VSRVVGYDLVGEPGVHRGLPSTDLTLILAIDEPIVVRWPGSPTPTTSWALLSGLHLGPAQIIHGARQAGVQVDLTVGGARSLLGVPAAALHGALLDLGDVAPALRHLAEAVNDPPPGVDPATLAARLLADEARRCDAAPLRAEVGRALRGLTTGASVTDVAAEVGFSRRRLATLVRDETGVSPKQYARLARFERSQDLLRRRIRTTPPPTAAAAATNESVPSPRTAAAAAAAAAAANDAAPAEPRATGSSAAERRSDRADHRGSRGSGDRAARADRGGDRSRWPTLAAIAARTGYADHAHLTREWQDLAGCTPTAWLAEEFPNLQALGAALDRH